MAEIGQTGTLRRYAERAFRGQFSARSVRSDCTAREGGKLLRLPAKVLQHTGTTAHEFLKCIDLASHVPTVVNQPMCAVVPLDRHEKRLRLY